MDSHNNQHQLTRRHTTSDTKQQRLILTTNNPSLDTKNQERDRTMIINDKN